MEEWKRRRGGIGSTVVYSKLMPPNSHDVIQMLDDVDVKKQSNPLEDSVSASNSSCITSLEIGPIFVAETARYGTKREESFAEGTASLPASAQGDPGR